MIKYSKCTVNASRTGVKYYNPMQPADKQSQQTHFILFLIENIQLKKIQERILEILVTALLENIDLLLQFLMYMITKYF